MDENQKHNFICALEWITSVLGTPYNCREVIVMNARTGSNITGVITHHQPEVISLRELLEWVRRENGG